VNNELDGLQEEDVWPELRYYPGIFLKLLRKTTKFSVMIVGFPSKI
jgi:hypothetical protein